MGILCGVECHKPNRIYGDQYFTKSLSDALVVDDFERLYGYAPVWQCRLFMEEGYWAGALAMSQDRVGRRFPILVLIKSMAGEDAWALAHIAETQLYNAFAQGHDADSLLAALEVVPRQADEPSQPESASKWQISDVEGRVVSALAGLRPEGLIEKILLSSKLGFE